MVHFNRSILVLSHKDKTSFWIKNFFICMSGDEKSTYDLKDSIVTVNEYKNFVFLLCSIPKSIFTLVVEKKEVSGRIRLSDYPAPSPYFGSLSAYVHVCWLNNFPLDPFYQKGQHSWPMSVIFFFTLNRRWNIVRVLI